MGRSELRMIWGKNAYLEMGLGGKLERSTRGFMEINVKYAVDDN